MGFDFKEISKGGWHPKGKDGSSKESWRGDFKGMDQISGWMNKGKGAVGMGGGEVAKEPESTHMVTPLSSLRDPATFAPPPKRTTTFGGITPTRSLVAGASSNAFAGPGSAQPQPEPKVEKPPPQPYGRDTTGQLTSHLPPPPRRKDGADGRVISPAAPALKPKPSLPPRLPQRQTENPNEHTPAPPPPYSATHEAESSVHQGILKQNSMKRLGAAGVSVPGFGIGPSPSPPLPTRRAAQPPPPAAKPSTSQLGELQSRFARLDTSSLSQQPEQPAPPSQGTTWAQKQAALKTASSFQKDPSSISFSDARNAASTANNFRERHGAQVASGLNSANNLNNKYGLTDKAAAYGMGNKAPEQDSGIVMRDFSGQPSHPSAVSGKKAPPPRPKKRPELLGTQQASGPPPPIPHASKPEPQMQGKPAPPPSARPPVSSPSTFRQQEFDLDLQSEWYAAQPPHWPPQTIKNITDVRALSYTNGWHAAGARKTCTFTGILTTTDLGRTKIRIAWDAAAPKLTAKGEQIHLPPPQPLGPLELERCQRVYGEALAAWCESQMGRKVGNGECWTLADDGLKAVAEECKARGEEPCMASQSLAHGAQVYSFISPNAPSHPSVLAAGVRRGDLIQFWKARFENEHGWKTAGMPDHTSVVVNVRQDGVMEVLEQNTGGVKLVKRGEYDLGTLTEGEVRVFRPVGVSWLGDMTPSWP